MRRTYEEDIHIEKCACCGRRIWHGIMWAIEVDVSDEEEPRKWHFCHKCCPTKGFAEAIATEFEARFSNPPAKR